IGRTARAGAAGVAISFCDIDERALLVNIERVTKSELPVDKEHPYHSAQAAKAPRNGSQNPKSPTGWRGKRGNFRSQRRNSRPGRKTAAHTS
ncbi:MAG: ATP-dependent helicase, partial [Nitrospinota bacterium]